MRTLIDLRNQNTIQQATLSKTVNEYRVKLQERLDEASEKSSEYCKTLRTSALNSENSRTGKPLAIKVVENLEAIQARKEAEVVSVRLENIKLRNKLKRDELLLRQKEELADGLHLIDFEQLKIENQTYNEKIEERNEDLLKLRKKITNVVQVLTHVKEKLHFVTNDNIELMGQLKELDMKVSHERDALPIEKRKREELRNGNTFIKQKNGLLGNVGLLKDFEDKVKSGEELQRQIVFYG